MSRASASLQAAIVVALVSLSAFSACGDDSPGEEAAGGGSAGSSRGGSGGGGKASRGGSASAGDSNAAGAPAGEGGNGDGATNAGGTSSGEAGSAAGGDPTGGGADNAGGAIQVPGPGPGGGSVYAVECSGETVMCGTEFAHCLGLMLPEDQVGFACSNHCDTVADCSTVDTGAEAQPGCVAFTEESRCMLICHQQGTDYACPVGMSCYIFPMATVGWCLWM